MCKVCYQHTHTDGSVGRVCYGEGAEEEEKGVTDLQKGESSQTVDYVRRMSTEGNIAQPHPTWRLTGSAIDLTGRYWMPPPL